MSQVLGALEAHSSKKDLMKQRLDLVVRGRRNHTHQPLSQGNNLPDFVCPYHPVLPSSISVVYPGDCPEGWSDASAVELGCVYADVTDANVDEVTKNPTNFEEEKRILLN